MAAVAVTADDISVETGVTPARAGKLLAAATALVDRFAPAAPEAIKDEATIRTAGWLAEQPAASVRSEAVGDVSTAYAPAMASALRHSGAMALLAPWKVRRAGAI